MPQMHTYQRSGKGYVIQANKQRVPFHKVQVFLCAFVIPLLVLQIFYIYMQMHYHLTILSIRRSVSSPVHQFVLVNNRKCLFTYRKQRNLQGKRHFSLFTRQLNPFMKIGIHQYFQQILKCERFRSQIMRWIAKAKIKR